MATCEEINWAYNTFLQRQPESTRVYESLKDLRLEEICISLARSNEFRSREPSPFAPETVAATDISDDYGKRILYVDLGDKFVSWNCINASYEPAETKLIADIMRENPGTFVDGGANIGWHSINIGMLEKTIVHSFEPRSFTYRCLSQSVTANHLQEKVHIHNRGLSDSEQTAELYWSRSGINPGGATIDNTLDTADHLHETISLLALDTLNLHNVRLIKLDIEGAEYLGIKGSIQTINRNKPIVILEILQTQIERVSGVSSDQLICFMRDLGYINNYIIVGDGTLSAIAHNPPYLPSDLEISNILFTHETSPRYDCIESRISNKKEDQFIGF